MPSLPPAPPCSGTIATLTRILSAFVSEGLVQAQYAQGRAQLQLEGIPPIPLLHMPVLTADGSSIAMLDPMDIDALSFPASLTIADLVHAFARSLSIPLDTEIAILSEFESAAHWTSYALANPPPLPTLSSPPIVFEQSIIYGHPTHPMHKTRFALPPLRLEDSYDLLHPRLRLIAVPATDMCLSGEFLSLIKPFLNLYPTYELPGDDWLALPVHELQVAHIIHHFKDVHLYPPSISIAVDAQQSLRSVLVKETFNVHLKLPLGIKLTSAVRTISPPSATFGVPFCETTLPLLSFPHDKVTVLTELASAISTHPDPLVARHIACIIRENPVPVGEVHIVSTALVDRREAWPDALFQLGTHKQRLAFYLSYVTLLIQCFIPSIIHDGLAFECHPQNTILRVKLTDGGGYELLGFYLRDFGGLKIHAASLPPSSNIFSYANPSHSIFSSSKEDVWIRMYHTLIHNHIQQLARVMGLHYSGEAYKPLPAILLSLPGFPKDHPWLTQPTQPGKCFLRMRLAQMDRYHLHAPFPNLVMWRGEGTEFSKSAELELETSSATTPFTLPSRPHIAVAHVRRWGKIEG